MVSLSNHEVSAVSAASVGFSHTLWPDPPESASKQTTIVRVTHRDPDHQTATALDGPLRGRRELVRIGRAQAVDAASLGHLHRIDRPEVHSIRLEVFSLLRQLDERVAAVFDHDGDKRGADAFGGLQLLT